MPGKLQGASDLEILSEPDWARSHSHRVGTRTRDARFMGLTHAGDEALYELEETAEEKLEELRKKVREGGLVTIRDVMTKQTDFHLARPDLHPRFWRYVLHATEQFLKYEQPWPVNQKRKEKEEEEEKRKKRRRGRRKRQKNKANRKMANEDDKTADKESDEEDQGPKISMEEQALLDCLQYEQKYRSSMRRNDGKGHSPYKDQDDGLPSQIDEADQFSPDSWIPRSDNLIRLTGKHPMNAEPDLSAVFDAGFITPSCIHYVRNHGAVPHLLWENHKLEITAGKQLTLQMDELRDKFDSINIPIFLACDGNRRKELNMIRKTRAFNYTAAAASCAYWKGVLLRDVLLAADIGRLINKNPGKYYWVNFEGADELSEGKYATCVPLDYAMDPSHDVLLAYEMNDHPIPADHGYPLRLMLPGWVGARSVKWLAKVWITEKENDSYYHIYDNRQLPSFVTDVDSQIAETMFHHPSTICNKQMLNSVIVKPAQSEKISLVDVRKGKTYRIEGFAYNGSGNEIERVEISLDDGETWLYCIRKYPDAPFRHARKFWTWLHWHIDLDLSKLIRAPSIIVRAIDEHKNTQPPKPVWNITGMMNNCWYKVIPSIDETTNDTASLLFQHPVEPGNGSAGWMKESTEEQMKEIERKASAPEKEFTRQKIEKHHSHDDCWIVVNNNVYDVTGVLSWHPGGKGPIMGHAGAVHMDTTEEFGSIHDDYAQAKLKECIIGKVTDKAMSHMEKDAQAKAQEKAARGGDKNKDFALHEHKWTQAKLSSKKRISPDTQIYTFALPPPAKCLGLQTGQHVLVGFHFSDKLVTRPYTPIRPVLDSEDDGTFDLVVKTYLPDEDQPGGTLSNILDVMREGEEIEVKGPAGGIRYLGNGRFAIDDKEYEFENVSFILGGSGVTPGYQIIARMLNTPSDKTKIKAVYANKSEGDILLREQLDDFVSKHGDQFSITHVLSHPSDEWKGLKGHVNEGIIKEHTYGPDEKGKSVALLCGPPTMIQKAALPALKDWGFDEEKNLFGF
ncbi:putative nitrate reductase [Aspergillus undulatus]|uniref:putative nitrate reductase n=1 Tax=Aspergillus undulatus TaxID=1810928 RepID=UPI003CCD3D89